MPDIETLPPAPPPLTVYRPDQRQTMSFVQIWSAMARNIWRARELIWQLFWRDIVTPYKKSSMGAVWIFSGPLVQVVPLLLAARVKVYNPGETSVDLVVYLMVGRACWSAFSEFYNGATSTLSQGGGLILQVNYPHEALFAKQLLSNAFTFVQGFIVTAVVMAIYHVSPNWGWLLFPFTLLPLICLGCALGLVVSMLRVVAFDFHRITTIVMGLLLWTAPVLYSDTHPPHQLLRTINVYNPLTYLVCTSREMLLSGGVYNGAWDLYLIIATSCVLILLLSLRLFYTSENMLAERML